MVLGVALTLLVPRFVLLYLLLPASTLSLKASKATKSAIHAQVDIQALLRLVLANRPARGLVLLLRA